MMCPTCNGGQLRRLASMWAGTIYWCPICGTYKEMCGPDNITVTVPTWAWERAASRGEDSSAPDSGESR